MKIDPRYRFNFELPSFCNRQKATIVKCTTTRSRDYITEFESVAVPYCPWASDFLLAENEPSMQVVSNRYRKTMAAVSRHSIATASLSNATECKARIFQTMIPRKLFILEFPALLGAGGIVKPTQTLDPRHL